MKVCNSCKTSKPTGEFGNNKRTPDGLMRQCKTCNNSRVSRYFQDRVDPERRYRRHGITQEMFNQKLEEQGGVCPICSKSKPNMVADHDHSHCPGHFGCEQCFRGVLCHGCNTAIGMLGDTPEGLQKALDYLVP